MPLWESQPRPEFRRPPPPPPATASARSCCLRSRYPPPPLAHGPVLIRSLRVVNWLWRRRKALDKTSRSRTFVRTGGHPVVAKDRRREVRLSSSDDDLITEA